MGVVNAPRLVDDVMIAVARQVTAVVGLITGGTARSLLVAILLCRCYEG